MLPKASTRVAAHVDRNRNYVPNITFIPTPVFQPVTFSLFSSSESSTPQLGRKLKKKIDKDFVSDF